MADRADERPGGTSALGRSTHYPPPRHPYLWAAAFCAAAVALRWALNPLLGENAPLIVLLIAPVLAAAHGGFGPAVFATVLSGVAGVLLFMQPVGYPLPVGTSEWTRVTAFVIEGVLFGYVIDARRRVIDRLTHEQHALAESQRALASRERRFRVAIEASPSGMLLVSPDGRIELANRLAASMFGYAPHELAQMSVDALVPDGLRARHAVERRDYQRAPVPHIMGEGRELRGQRKDGSTFPVEVGLNVVADEDKTLVLASVADITARRQNEENERRRFREMNAELERRVDQRTQQLTDANLELEAFAHSVAHDLRAPLRNVQGFAEALLEDYADQLPTEGADYARRMVAATERMDRLILDLLAYARLGRAELAQERVSIEAVVRGVRDDLAGEIQRRGATVTLESPLPDVCAHGPTVTQVLENLVSNAIKFAAPGGAPPRVTVSARECSGIVRVSVRDNGIGIDPAHHERIFHMFERLHDQERYPGTGVGLAIVRKGVTRMGGRVGVDSASGRGSTFWFELPAAAANATVNSRAASAPAPARSPAVPADRRA